MVPVFVNGKYLAQRTTGVQRVAASLVQALDALPATAAAPWVLLHPRGVPVPALRRLRAVAVGWRGMPLHLWEQLALPWAARSGLLVNLAGSAPGLSKRQVCQVHDAAVYDIPVAYTRCFTAWYKPLFHWLAWRKVQFLTVSEYSRQRLVHHLRIDDSRITVLFNGCDHLDAVPADERVLQRLGLVDTPFLLAVASRSPAKNLPRLMQAFARLPADRGCRLVLVGGGNDTVFRPAGEAASTSQRGVVHAGTVDDAALKALYRHATALVVPSLYEGFGLPVVEAMRLGCPVLAAEAAALPEVCAGAALAFDPLSVEAIADAMARVLADASLRQRLRQAGLARTAGLSWQRAAGQLQQFVEQAGRP